MLPKNFDSVLENQIVQIVNQILTIREPNPDIDTAELEIEIDHIVYKLYELTEEEIMIGEE